MPKFGSSMRKTLSPLFKELDDNTMFHLSLGSKELFHSNFLEFLWNQSPVGFLKMLLNLLQSDGKEILKNKFPLAFEESMIFEKDVIKKMIFDRFTMAREEKNFDICIYHKEGKTTIYDVIIENKVKSIPYKEQLQDYENKVGKNKNVQPIYILLSLATEFPNKNIISNDDTVSGWKRWEIVSYQNLAFAIKESYITFIKEQIDNSTEKQEIQILEKVLQYIEDYVIFIKSLDKLKGQELQVSNDAEFMQSPFLDTKKYNKFRDVRLHDLYVKIRGSYFICLVKEELSKNLSNVIVSFSPGGKKEREAEKNKKYKNKTVIWLASEMTNAKQSTITARIRTAGSQYTYEIQIEGDSYRHMLNHKEIELCSKRKDLEVELLDKMSYFDYHFLPEDICIRWEPKKRKTKDGNYFQYKNVLYKKVLFNRDPSIDYFKVNQMMQIFIEDINFVLKNLENFDKQAKKIEEYK